MSLLTAKSFIFNGISSTDFDVVIGWIDSKPDTLINGNGLNREIKKAENINKIKHDIYGTVNSDVITFNFCIVKIDGEEITRIQSMQINEWLTSSSLPQLLKFNDDDAYELHYYAICTEINDIIIGGHLVGKELTFETNSSFAFARKSEKTFQINNSLNFNINSLADNDIYYPIITIMAQSDKIIIENITDERSVTILTQDIISDKNGQKIIKLNSNEMSLTDNNNNLIPMNKIGWNEEYTSYVSSVNKYITYIYWPRLLKGMNNFKVTGTCTIKIEYEFPRKAGCL